MLIVSQNNKQALQNCCNHFTALYFAASLHSTSNSSISLVRKLVSFRVQKRYHWGQTPMVLFLFATQIWSPLGYFFQLADAAVRHCLLFQFAFCNVGYLVKWIRRLLPEMPCLSIMNARRKECFAWSTHKVRVWKHILAGEACRYTP